MGNCHDKYQGADAKRQLFGTARAALLAVASVYEGGGIGPDEVAKPAKILPPSKAADRCFGLHSNLLPVVWTVWNYKSKSH